MLALSLALHLVFFFGASRLALFRNDLPQTSQAIYVDVVNLPVASPQAGSPSGGTRGEAGGAPPVPVAPPTPAPPAMKLPAGHTAPARPARPSAKAPAAKAPPAAGSGESARQYEERLAALERNAEVRHQEAALADIRNRIGARTGGGPAGMPGGTGTQAGSDYAAYLQSRLRDSFELTIAWQTKKPYVAVRLTVDARGNLTSYKIEKSSGDVVFEDAVVKAIQLARKNFPPPPGGKEFSYGYVFKPEGVDKK